jgi:alpha-L-fucosidase
MKNQASRRNFIKKSALFTGAAVSLPLLPSFAADTNEIDPNALAADATPTAPPPATPAIVLPPAPTPIPAPPGFGVAPGPFKPTWESLANYQVPDWFRDAKLGIWAHWGPQCQPEMGDWYGNRMYQFTNADYKFHCQKYGHPSKFGFKDVINVWKAEKWDPEYLIGLYKKAGAKYFAALANHHDNLDLWDSKYQPWNSVAVGPKKDIIGGWEKAARANGLRFAVTCHGDRAWSWYGHAQGADPSGPLAGVPYDGRMTKADGKGKWWEGLDPQDLYAQYHKRGKYNWAQDPSEAGTPVIEPVYCEKFFNRVIDLLDKHKPDLLYFDDTILPLYPTSEIGLRIAAYFYNTNLIQNGGKLEAVLTGKGLSTEQRRALVMDRERGVSDAGETLPWQTDTCIGDWHYRRSLFEEHKYKTAKQVVQMLIDIVSKNGNLMLNIPLRGDGTIDDDELKVIKGLTSWIEPNGEGIFATRPWKVYGEGPSVATAAPRGHFFNSASDVRGYADGDYRFTCKGDTVFAFLMNWPADGKTLIKSLAQGGENYPGEIAKVELLGTPAPLSFTRDATGLLVTLPDLKPNDFACCFKITAKS